MSKHAIYDLRQSGQGLQLTSSTALTAAGNTAWEPFLGTFSALLSGSATGITAVVEVSQTDPSVAATPVTLDTLSGAAPVRQTYALQGLFWARVRVTATSGALGVALSGPSNMLSLPVPGVVTAPAVSGTPTVGQTLSCTQGVWSNGPSSYAYQWFRGSNAIAGATATTYLLVSADLSFNIRCQVTATNDDGSASVKAEASNRVQPAAIVLGVIGPSTATVAPGAAPGTPVAVITGKTQLSNLYFSPDDGRLAMVGDDVSGFKLVVGKRGLSGNLAVTFEEDHPLASNSGRLSFLAINVGAGAVLASLTVGGQLPTAATFTTSAAAGTGLTETAPLAGALVFDTVEAGATMSISPNDGRIAFDTTGKPIVGLTASSTGTTAYTITKAKAGFASVSVTINVVVTAGAFPAVSWNAEIAQPGYSPNTNGASGTDLSTLAGWTKSGTGSITMNGSSRLNFNSSDATGCAYAYDTGATSRYIDVQHKALANSAVGCCGVMIDQNNYLGCRLTSSGFNITGKVGGTFISDTTVVGSNGGSYPPPTATAYTPVFIRMEVINNTIAKYYVNGCLIATLAVPSTFASTTKVGFVARNSGNEQGLINAINIGAGRINHGHTQGIGGSDQFARPIYAGGKIFGGATVWTKGDPSTPVWGESRVYSIDAVTGATTFYTLAVGAGWGDGSHAAPSITSRPDGRLVATYSQHNDTTGVRYRISVNPYDATAWSQEYVIPSTSGSGVTYTNAMYMSGPGRLYCFFRGGDRSASFAYSSDVLTATASADGGALSTTPTWSAVTGLIPLPSGSAQGIYTSYWSDGVDRIDIVATNAVDAVGNDVDVRHAYYSCSANTLQGTAGGAITAASATTFASMTALATSGAPDNLGVVFCLDVRRRANGHIEALWYQSVSATEKHYFYSLWNGSSWVRNEIASIAQASVSGTIDADNTGGSLRVGGAALDFNSEGLVYVSVGNHTQTDIFAFQTVNGGTSFTSVKVSPPANPNPDGSPSQVLAANVYPAAPRNAPTTAAVLWSKGRWDYFTNDVPFAYALDVMSAGSNGTTLVP